jgi:hypothetical protein
MLVPPYLLCIWLTIGCRSEQYFLVMCKVIVDAGCLLWLNTIVVLSGTRMLAISDDK